MSKRRKRETEVFQNILGVNKHCWQINALGYRALSVRLLAIPSSQYVSCIVNTL